VLLKMKLLVLVGLCRCEAWEDLGRQRKMEKIFKGALGPMGGLSFGMNQWTGNVVFELVIY